MVDTIWKIGDIVYGVHTQVSDGKFYVGVTEEKINRFTEGWWYSSGYFMGDEVVSDVLSAFDTKEGAIVSAEHIAQDAEMLSKALNQSGVWKEVIRLWEE